jgi:DNA-binding CsgD family transcriptional regulator
MSHSTRIPAPELLRLMRHFVDVAALKSDPPAQRQLLVDGLNRLVGTNQAIFFIADAWRAGRQPTFLHQTLTHDRDPTFLHYVAALGINYPLTADAFVDHSIADPRKLQYWGFPQVLSDRAAQRRYQPFMDACRAGHVSDGAVCIYRPDNSDRVVGVGMHQFRKAPCLRPRQRAVMTFAIDEIRRMVEAGHLPLPAQPPAELSPRLGQILDRLLAAKSPKQIARELHLSVWTVREHIHRLYQHFGVSTREELMARFIHDPIVPKPSTSS